MTGGLSLGFGLGLTVNGGGVHGPYPAPTGYRWAHVTENSIVVTENGAPVVALERAV